MADAFQVPGRNSSALFSLKLHRGDGMVLIAMNWKKGEPPDDFVGFAIEYCEPGGDRFFAVKNRLAFPGIDGAVSPIALSTLRSPIQKFRWVHFPRNAELDGEFVYRVKPVFMNAHDELSYGVAQEAAIELSRETYPDRLNVTFTRGFVSSQAFVDRYQSAGKIDTLLPAKADDGLIFKPKHEKADEALAWMGFEARHAILETLDQAIGDKAEVRVVAYDLNEPDVVDRLERIGKRLKIIIDDSDKHGAPHSAESQAAERLTETAGAANVQRQHMGGLQHNKVIVVNGRRIQKVVCGSTNFSWRGFFVQSNNALVLTGKRAIRPFLAAFEAYWENDVDAFGTSPVAEWSDLGLKNIDAQVAFSPHGKENALLGAIAEDIGRTKSSLLFSLAFLYQTKGAIRDAVTSATNDERLFVYGISDKKVGGFDLLKPGGNIAPIFPANLATNVPAPFSAEPVGGGGTRMHHKFVVIDFDKPTARVYLGSYNFSEPADRRNGENLLLIRDRRVVTSYMVEALRIFDHYHFRVAQDEATKAKKTLQLSRPPRKAGERTWWAEDYADPRKIRDRELFA